MQGGNFSNVSASASRLILRRKASLPSELKPTMWNVSLPISRPITVGAGDPDPAWAFMLLLLLKGLSLQTTRWGEQPVHPISRRSLGPLCGR